MNLRKQLASAETLYKKSEPSKIGWEKLRRVLNISEHQLKRVCQILASYKTLKIIKYTQVGPNL